MTFDTIAAIATPFGTGGLSVIRVSGVLAIEKVNTIFKGKNLLKVKGNTIHYGHILEADGSTLDEVMVSVFIEPHSFTKENVVEISTHGGVLITQKVLERILETGVKLAEPGEFTKRAYLNGRIDLVQAEAVMDLIAATNENAIKVANKALAKETSKLIENLKQKVLTLIAKIEVNIDYPEYDDAEVMSKEIVYPEVKSLLAEIDDILRHSKKTQFIRDGVKTVIIGRPNVGKSSLLNALLDEERAIVSDIEGTTRDTIDAYINLSGVTLHLIDTAGIRNALDTIEKIGVERSRKALKDAELVLMVLDLSKPLTKEDEILLDETKHHERIIIGNKKDLPRALKMENLVEISSLEKSGLKELEQIILQKLELDHLSDKDFNYLSNVRHIQKLKEAKQALESVVSSIEADFPVDMYAIDLTRSWNLLGEILGNNQYGQLLSELFSKFCLGK